MALPPAAPTRQLKHRRSIDMQIFARDDGLWEVDAGLVVDPNTRALPMAVGVRPAGTPPFQIDRCHAVRSRSDAVRLHHPKWYRADSAQNPPPTAP